ncbi:MAG: YihA family ribosome biogenesis GTP-binding protein [Sulfuricella sp.]|nr:YihA family ribosome biogenesis GTP-binding protein [Sulfuricella sp.]
MSLFQHATFLTSANAMSDLPAHGGIEIAFAGRSNAGKSSAINTLANRNRLAYVSKTPGRTQLINFFELGADRYLVDLPGYGYADVPDKIRLHWQHILSTYLMSRAALNGLVLIMDARHPLTKLDWQMLEWFGTTGKPVHILLTKSDKLSRQQATDTLRKVRAELRDGYPQCTVQLFSSLKRLGLEEAEVALTRLLGGGEETQGAE